MKRTTSWSEWVAGMIAVAVLAVGVTTAHGQAGDIARSPYIGAIVVDARTGEVLKEDGANRPGYPASMLKLMDMFIILDALDDGAISLQDIVRVTKHAYEMGGSQVYLDPHESVSVEELLYAMMVKSANDAAMLMAEYVGGTDAAFVDRMNAKARELGLSPVTHFISPHGLPPKEGRPDMTTPADFAKLCVALLREHPEILGYTSVVRREFHPVEPRKEVFIMDNTNPLLKSYGGCDGLKTGYFKKAGFSIAATASRGDARVVAVIMGCASKDERNALATAWLNEGLAKASHGPMPAPQRPKKAAEKAAAQAAAEAAAAQAAAEAEQQALAAAEAEAAASAAEAPADEEAESAPRHGGGWLKSILWIVGGALVVWIILLIIKRRLLVSH